MKTPRRAALALALVALTGCEDRRGMTAPAAPRPVAAAAEPPARVEVRWDPATGRGDVIHHLSGGDLLRTCFQCRFQGYTGGLAIGAEGGSGMALYPKTPIRGYREINVWCAQDESIWDRDLGVEYGWGWSENFGTGRDGERLELVRGEVVVGGPERVVLRASSLGGCYRVTRVATTERDARYWVLATRITNVCDRPVHFDFFSGEDPWIGHYRSSDGDVGWTRDGVVRHEAAFGPGEWTEGGLYDLGNSALGQGEASFSKMADALVLDPATPLPDVVLYANRFAHDASEVDPARALDNQSLTAVNLGWRDRTLRPGEGLTVAMALGLADTGEPGPIPRAPRISDAAWSAWRAYLVEGARRDDDVTVRFAAERVTLDVARDRVHVGAVYALRNPGSDATVVRIRYPILVAADRPAPDTVTVDGRAHTPVADVDGTVSVTFPVQVPPHAITRFQVDYDQAHTGREAAYLVTTARRWSHPVARAVFIVRPAPDLGEVTLSFPGARTRRVDGRAVHTLAFTDFAPDHELVVRW